MLSFFNQQPTPNLTPTMVIMGDPFGESRIAIFLDGEEVFYNDPDDVSMAVGLTVSAYFFNKVQKTH